MIGKKEVERIAGLSRLSVTEAEKESLGPQLSGILNYMEKLNGLDTSGVAPTSHVLDILNVTREDIGRPSLSTAEALMNAPDGTDKFFRVPKIIE